MANTFEIIGKLAIGKESEKFKPYSSKTYDSGWVNNELNFNAIAGDNRHMLKIKGGYMKDGSGKVFTFSKSGKSDSDEVIKGEKLEIAWKDRFKPEIIENVAEFKKFVIDVEEQGKRFKLEKALDKFKEGLLQDGDLEELGVTDIEKAFEDSKKKRKEFIAEADFAEYIYKLISSGKIDNRMFKILGNIVYSEYKGKIYKNLMPTRIYLAEKDAVPSSTAQITLFFNKNSLDSTLLKKTGKYYINGFVRDYDSSRKTDIPCNVSLVIDTNKDEQDETSKKFNALMLKQFTVKDKSWKEFGLKVNMLDGAQKVEITDDMLNDFQKEMIELNPDYIDEIRKELGGNVYGDRIQEFIITSTARGYSKGVKDTKYIDSDFVIPEIEIKDKPNNSTEDDDIFDLDEIPF